MRVSCSDEDDDEEEEGDVGEDGDDKEVVKTTNALVTNERVFSGSGLVEACE